MVDHSPSIRLYTIKPIKLPKQRYCVTCGELNDIEDFPLKKRHGYIARRKALGIEVPVEAQYNRKLNCILCERKKRKGKREFFDSWNIRPVTEFLLGHVHLRQAARMSGVAHTTIRSIHYGERQRVTRDVAQKLFRAAIELKETL